MSSSWVCWLITFLTCLSYLWFSPPMFSTHSLYSICVWKMEMPGGTFLRYIGTNGTCTERCFGDGLANYSATAALSLYFCGFGLMSRGASIFTYSNSWNIYIKCMLLFFEIKWLRIWFWSFKSGLLSLNCSWVFDIIKHLWRVFLDLIL